MMIKVYVDFMVNVVIMNYVKFVFFSYGMGFV